MRQVLSSLLVIAGLVSGQAIAAPESPPHADIRDSGFVYCVSGQVNTFNPSKASSGLIVDTLAAQFYDRLLDVDPYTYRLMPELAESWEVLDNGATYRFHLRRDVGRICREVRERRSPGATRPSTGRHRSVSVVGIPRRAIYSLTTS